MGSSEAQTKTVTTITEHTCPIVVNKDNWLGGYGYSDTFSVRQRETDIVVTRTDSTSGWGMNLEFRCCGSGKVSYTYIYIFHIKKLHTTKTSMGYRIYLYFRIVHGDKKQILRASL